MRGFLLLLAALVGSFGITELIVEPHSDGSEPGPIIWSPARAELWLALAGSPEPLPPHRRFAFFEMAYLMGAKDSGMLPKRLVVAARALDLRDPKVRGFVAGDIALLIGAHDPKGVLFAAYRQAGQANRAEIVAMVNPIDPTLAKSLTAQTK